MEGDPAHRAADGARGRHHRVDPRARALGRRDRAAVAHRAGERFLQHGPAASDRRAAPADLPLRALSVRRLAPQGVGRIAAPGPGRGRDRRPAALRRSAEGGLIMSTSLRDPRHKRPEIVTARPAPRVETPATERSTAVRVEHLDAWYGQHHAISGVTFDMPAATVTAIIGPSGCGKSTLIRCLNRMHEATPGAYPRGGVFIGATDIYSPYADPVPVRSTVGMVFQKPNPFPMMSVYDNVAAGPRLRGWKLTRRDTDDLVERNLRRAALWDEVKDKLHRSA